MKSVFLLVVIIVEIVLLHGSDKDIHKIETDDKSWIQELGDSFTLEGSKDQYPILVWENKL